MRRIRLRPQHAGTFGLVALLTHVLVTGVAAQNAHPVPPQPVGTIGESAGTGPWPAIAESVASFRTHTIYHPVDLPDEKLPLVVWGNGACRDDGLSYGAFLREIASHGFFVISLGYPRAKRGLEAPQPPVANAAPPAPPPAPGARNVDPTQASQMIEAMEWAGEQTESGSFRNWIDMDRIAIMGHSCGGLQAIRVSADPRVSTSMIFNSGVLNGGPASGRSGIQVTKDELSKLHAPVAYITGGPTDIAHPNAVDDVSRIDGPPLFFAYNGIGHGGTFRVAPNGGDYAEIAVAWLSWRLKGDIEASRTFIGRDCTLCADPDWTVGKQPVE